MTRQYKEVYVTADSPFGVVKLAFWGDTIRAITEGEAITVNNVKYNLDAEFVRQPDGSYSFRGYHTGLNRADRWTRTDDVSRSAIEKVRQKLPEWLNEYVKDHDMLVTAGYLATANNDILRKLDKVSAARTALEKSQEEYEGALQAELELLLQHGVVASTISG